LTKKMFGKNRYWGAILEKVTGASHVQKGTPCEDAGIYNSEGQRLIVAIADGHGSEKCPRAAKGAELAAQAAVYSLTIYANQIVTDKYEGKRRNASRFAEETVPKNLLREWHRFVKEDYEKEPMLEHPPEDDRALFKLYGTTVLAALMEKDYALFLQLGDGCIALFTKAGEVDKVFLLGDEFLGNETTSLSLPNAETAVELHYQHLENRAQGILLATDGFTNSFLSEADFNQYVVDLFAFRIKRGTEWLNKKLLGWLTELSSQGSGDDITVALVYSKK